VNFLIHEGQRAVTTVRDAIDNAIYIYMMSFNILGDTFNTWFSSRHSSLDEVGGAQCLDDAIEKDDCIYHARQWHDSGSDNAGSSTS